MGVNRMSGTPWHIEKLSRKEDDDRRDKRRCQYYQKDGNYCRRIKSRCFGSAHCAGYCEIEQEEVKETIPAKTVSAKTRPTHIRVPASKNSPVREIEIFDGEGKKLFPKGCVVRHKSYGLGSVKDNTDGRITVKFADGSEKSFGLDICVKNKLLERL